MFVSGPVFGNFIAGLLYDDLGLGHWFDPLVPFHISIRSGRDQFYLRFFYGLMYSNVLGIGYSEKEYEGHLCNKNKGCLEPPTDTPFLPPHHC